MNASCMDILWCMIEMARFYRLVWLIVGGSALNWTSANTNHYIVHVWALTWNTAHPVSIFWLFKVQAGEIKAMHFCLFGLLKAGNYETIHFLHGSRHWKLANMNIYMLLMRLFIESRQLQSMFLVLTFCLTCSPVCVSAFERLLMNSVGCMIA